MFEIKSDVKIHFVGIGGIGMSGIAEVLLTMGYKVSGSDMSESPSVDRLRKLGAQVYIGHRKENIDHVTVLVYSSAIDDSNPEIIVAKEDHIPIMKRAEMLAELMRLKHGLAVGGTHGKTTTTSFLSTILQESDIDPTYIIGGVVKNLDGHAKVGKGEILVAEADESDGSFLLLNPIMSVITNIDLDHMNYYGNEESLVAAFTEFANKVPFYGCCALNAHDSNLMKIKSDMKKPWVTFATESIGEEDIDFLAKSVKYSRSGASYDLFYKGKFATKIEINLPGEHNVLNSLGAISLSHNMGVSFDKIKKTITKFDGIGRRFQSLYQKDDFELIDDYAHHPTAILKTIQTLRATRVGSEIVVIFEPHRYTRTKECWSDFFHCFNDADKLILGPIYPASEKEIPGISTERLVADINGLHPNFATSLNSMDSIETIIKDYVGKNATVITLGAGSIGRVVREVVSSLSG